MNEERNLGVSEARYALSLVFCVLLGVGFLLLNQLGGAANSPPIESQPAFEAGTVAPQVAVPGGEEPPQVLTIESGEPAFQTSQLPNDLTSPRDDTDSARSTVTEPTERR